jgi:cytoplasmic iron level regulating protein YaaA (DUF328/UPF0246 family)
MSNKIFIITVFISNIAFGAILPIATIQKTVTQKQTQRIANKASQNLQSRGIQRKIAEEKINNILDTDNVITDLMAQNILKNVKSVKEENIVEFLSQAALQGKKVDLSSYATLISIVQKSSRRLIDKEMSYTLEKLSDENKLLKLQQVVTL